MATESDFFEQYRLAEFEHWGVFLHEDQSYLGRNYVALNRGEEGEENDPFLNTTSDEQGEFLTIISGVKVVLDELYQLTRLNYANLRNTWHHNHWHVIPRYETPEDGLRIVGGHEFRDLNQGRNYAPSPKHEVPAEVVMKIRDDMSEGLVSLS